MSSPTVDEMIAEREASQERLWQIVNKMTYKEFRKMQEFFAPMEDENE